MIDKKTLRDNNRILRRKLSEGGLIQVASFNIVEKIKNWDLYKSSKNIMIFYPLAQEINLLPLIKDKNKNFYLPSIIFLTHKAATAWSTFKSQGGDHCLTGI